MGFILYIISNFYANQVFMKQIVILVVAFICSRLFSKKVLYLEKGVEK
jgi:hypothetical protein